MRCCPDARPAIPSRAHARCRHHRPDAGCADPRSAARPDGAAASPGPERGLLARGRGGGQSGGRGGRGRCRGLWRQHRLRQARKRPHRLGSDRGAAAAPGALAHVRHRRALAGSDRSPHPGAEGREPGARPFRRAARHHRSAAGPDRARRPAGDPGQGLGRRLGRPGAAGTPGRLPDRRGRDAAARQRSSPRRRPCARSVRCR